MNIIRKYQRGGTEKKADITMTNNCNSSKQKANISTIYTTKKTKSMFNMNHMKMRQGSVASKE